jgi:hypothetical protein
MSKFHKYLHVYGSVFSGMDPIIRIRAKIPQICNTGKKGAVIMTSCFSKSTRKCHPVSKHLHVPIPCLYCKLLCFYMPVICIWCVYLINIWLVRSNCCFFWYSWYTVLNSSQGKRAYFVWLLKMYWYVKNLRNETMSQNNLDEIPRNFAKESTTNFPGIKITFVVISYFVK